MPDYKEQNVAGKVWQRANRIVIENPYGGQPFANICEQKAVEFAGQVQFTDLGVTLSVPFSPAETIPLRNPLTDELIGQTATHADLQVLLYSLTRAMQESRDAANAEE